MEMKNSTFLFSYKNGNSFFHRLPAWIKILVMPVLSILMFVLPFYVAAGAIIFQIGVGFYLHFSLKNQLQDLIPVLWYALILYVVNFLVGFFTAIPSLNQDQMAGFLLKVFQSVFFDFQTGTFLLQLFAVIQSCSLLFKTSSPLQIRQGFEVMEGAVRKILPFSKKKHFSQVLSMFVNFIPLCARNWQAIKKAWVARGGKTNLRMFFVLLPVFFCVGMNQAYKSAKAYAIRDEL